MYALMISFLNWVLPLHWVVYNNFVVLIAEHPGLVVFGLLDSELLVDDLKLLVYF